MSMANEDVASESAGVPITGALSAEAFSRLF